MQIICTSLQTDNHTNTSSLNFLQAICSSWCPTNSVKLLKAIVRPRINFRKFSYDTGVLRCATELNTCLKIKLFQELDLSLTHMVLWLCLCSLASSLYWRSLIQNSRPCGCLFPRHMKFDWSGLKPSNWLCIYFTHFSNRFLMHLLLCRCLLVIWNDARQCRLIVNLSEVLTIYKFLSFV